MSGNLRSYGKILLLLVLSAVSLQAGDYNLGKTLSDMLKSGYPVAYIQGYMKPLTTAMGTSINGASFHSAGVNFFPHMEIGAGYIFISVPENARYFRYNGQSYPTYFGPRSEENGTIPGSGLTGYNLPLLQLDLGMFSYFQASLRGTHYTISDMGEIRLFGVGVKYGLSDLVTIDFMPLDLSVQAFYHAYGIESWLSSGTFAINVQISSRFAIIPLELFTGLGYERVSLKVKSENLPDIGENAAGDILIDGDGGVRITLGAGINLFLFNLHAEYNYGFYSSTAAGLSIRF